MKHMHGRITHNKINNMHLKHFITRNCSERSYPSALQDHIAECQNKQRLCMTAWSAVSDHLTSVLGCVRATRRVVLVQPLQNILNLPELLLNVPVYQLTLGGKRFIETEKTHALLKHCQDHHNNAYSFLLIINESHMPSIYWSHNSFPFKGLVALNR